MNCDLCKTGNLATYEDDTGRKLCSTHANAVASGDWDGTAVDVEKIDNPVIDRHSVTCPFCGGLADERETVDLYNQSDTVYEGEAHEQCWQDFQDHDCEFEFDWGDMQAVSSSKIEVHGTCAVDGCPEMRTRVFKQVGEYRGDARAG